MGIEILLMLGIVAIAYFGGKTLASGSEQENYDAYHAKDSTMTPGQYEALISCPVVSEPWVPKYFRECGCSGIGCLFTAGDNTLSWYIFGVALIGTIFGLHFLLV